MKKQFYFILALLFVTLNMWGQDPYLSGYGIIKSGSLNYGDGGWAGWSVPAGKVVLGGGYQLTGGPASVSVPATPGSVWSHYTYGASEYGWVVQDAQDGAASSGSYVSGVYADLPPGYEIITHTINGWSAEGWGGWSCPAGKVVLGGGYYANGPVKASAPAGPNTVWPHYTYGPEEYGWVVQSAGATTITIYVICAYKPAGYEIVKSSQMNFSGNGFGGWSVPSGKVVLGGGFTSVSPVRMSSPAGPASVWPHYTYKANEYGWVLQSNGGGATTVYAIAAGGPVHNVTQNTFFFAIQPAIDAANADDVIEVAAGEYVENLVIDKANLTVKAVGAVTIKDVANPASWSGAGGTNMPGRDPVVFIKANGVTFEGFNIRDYQQKVGSPYIFSVVRVEGDGVTVKGLDMQSQYDVNYLTKASYELIVVAKGNNVTIENNTLARAKQNTLGTAILKVERELASGDIVGNVLLKGNTVVGGPVAVRLNPNATITVQDNNISDVNFEGLWVALQPGANLTGNLVFSGNTVTDFKITCGTCSAMKVVTKPASINDKTASLDMYNQFLSDNPNVPSLLLEWMGPVHNVTQDLFYTTIQAAINAAIAGDVIVVAAGTYAEQVNVTKSVTIKGNNTGISVGAIPGTRIPESIIDGGFYVHTAATGSVIDGFTIQSGYTTGGHKAGVVVGSSNLQIKNNIIKNCLGSASMGIETSYAANSLIIKDNGIFDNQQGIYLNPSDGISILGNVIHNNNGNGVGIGSDGQSNLTLTGNKIYNQNVEGWGISAAGANVVAHNNGFYDNNSVSIAHYTGAAIDASCNWWGTTDYSAIVPKVSGNVSFLNFLTSSDLNGDCIGVGPVVNLTTGQSYMAIQPAIDAASAGDVIKIPSGIYTGNVNTTGRGGLKLSIGASPGCVTINGNVTLTDLDTYIVDIQGTTECTGFDKETITGDFNAGGAKLEVVVGTGYVPVVTSEYNIFAVSGTITGAFSAKYYMSGGNRFNVEIAAHSISLKTSQPLAIDIALKEVGCGAFKVVLKPSVNLGSYLTNLQFTIKYPKTVMIDVVPAYGLVEGVTLPESVEFKYVTYTVAEFSTNGWLAGEEYPVLTFKHNKLLSNVVTGDFEILTNAEATINNTIYYAEYIGSDVTGTIYDKADNVWLGACPVHNETKDLWYYKIQAAIDDAAPADVVKAFNVPQNSGIYAENLVINKALTLVGPNADIAGNGSRNPEAVIQFPVGAADETGLIYVGSNISGVTIAGFDLECQDATITEGVFGHYLILTEKVNNLTIRNNKMYSSVIPMYILTDNSMTDYRTGLMVEGNYVDCGPNVNNGYNRGIYVQATSGTIQDNQFLNTNIGIQYMPYGHTTPGLIQRNIVSAGSTGLYHNYQTNGAAQVTWSHNEVSVAPNDRAGLKAQVYGAWTQQLTFQGMEARTFGTQGSGAAPQVYFNNNKVDGNIGSSTYYTSTIGYRTYDASATGIATLTENSFTNLNMGAVNNSSVTVAASCNWWGTANLSTIASKITNANVIYSPYLSNDTEIAHNYPGFYPAATCTTVVLPLKVWLQGPYSSGVMATSTGINAKIPTNQPFNVAPWSYQGVETLPAVVPADVVDWVLVEARSNAIDAVERSAGLLYKNGSVNVAFDKLALDGSYNFVVYHRNHMPVMSANLVPLSSFTAPLDLTVASNLYGTKPAINLEPGTETEPAKDVWGMIAGDVTHNGKLQYSGPGNDRGPILAKIYAGGGTGLNSTLHDGYWFEDVLLDNSIIYIGTSNDKAPIGANLGTLTGNDYLNAVYTSPVPLVNTGGIQLAPAFKNRPVSIDIDDKGIVLSTSEMITNGVVDNVQFTLAWYAGNKIAEQAISKSTSAFMLMPQGKPVNIDGVSHQVYVSTNMTQLPKTWGSNEPVNVMTFENSVSAGTLWIADNDFTATNNAMYYVSIWGEDYTGEIKSKIPTGNNALFGSEGIRLYPNPSNTGKVYVEMNESMIDNAQVSVYDVNGKVLRNTKMATAGNVITIDVSTLVSGIYFVRVVNNNTTQNCRFIVNN